MIRKLLLSAALLAGASIAAQQAAAQSATVTLTGTVLSGFDVAGSFGAAQANLAGLPFSAIFTVTPKAGSVAVNTPGYSSLSGYFGASPVITALAIGTGTHIFGGTVSGLASATNILGSDVLFYSANDFDSFVVAGFDTTRDLLSNADFSSYSTINLTPADNAKGYAQIANYTSFGLPIANTYATLSLNTISASVGAPVPEPATWAMMIVGFGVAGAAMRRQRTRTSARIAFA